MDSDTQLETALKNADKAGDMNAARMLAAEITRRRTPKVDWSKYYSGLDTFEMGLDSRQKQAFGRLNQLTNSDPETRAQSINQAYLKDQYPQLAGLASSPNWPTVRDTFAKTQGFTQGEPITDKELYNRIAQSYAEKADEGTLKGVSSMERTVGALRFRAAQMQPGWEEFWHNINRPVAELPRVSEANAPDIPQMGINNPAIVAGVYNGAIKPLLEGLESPLGIATVGVGSALAEAGKALPLARKAAAGISGLFTALMAKGAVEGGIQAQKVLNDPKASKQAKVEAVAFPVSQALLGVIGAFSTVHELAPESAEVLGRLKGKNIQDSAAEIRKEANNTTDPLAEQALNHAATQLESLSPPEIQKVPEKIQSAAIQLSDGTVLTGENHAQILERKPEGLDVGAKEGFLTTDGKFVDREQAKSIAQNADQLTPEAKQEDFKELHSHQVQMPSKAPSAVALDKLTSIKNEAVDAEMASMGMEPATRGETLSFQQAVSEAAQIISKDPEAGSKLVQELSTGARPITGVEDAILAHELVRLKAERDAAELSLVKAREEGSPEKIAEAQTRIAKARDDYADAAEVDKKVGTATAQGLALRRITLREDYSLASMERQWETAGAEKLTEKEASEVKKFHDKVVETGRKLDEHMAKQTTKEEAPKVQKQKIREYLAEQAQQARERMAKRLKEGRQMSGLDPEDLKDSAIIGADLIAKGVTKFAEWSQAMIKELGERIRPHLQDIFSKANETHDNAGKLEQFKKRTAKATEKVRERIATGDLDPKPRRSVVLDEEGTRLKADHERAKQDFQRALYDRRMAQRTPLERYMDTFSKWRRGFLLSSPATLAKLTGAAVLRGAITPVEEAVGAGLGKLPGVSKVAEMAPREGGLNIQAEAKAITDAFTKGMKDAADEIKKGSSDLDILYEQAKGARMRMTELPSSAIDFFGHLHAALKSPVKRAEFARSFEKRTAFAIKNGVDVTDPMVQTRLALDSFKDAQRAIFMQDNRFATAFQAAVKSLEKADKQTGQVPVGGKVAATALRTVLPIVKVPTNIVGEAVTYATGSVTGTVRLANALVKGFEKLSPEQADLIMRELKKGAIGAALLLLGYFNKDSVGGQYQRGEKRKPGAPKAGEIQINGVSVPSAFLHHPAVEVVNVGATAAQVADSKVKGGSKGPGAGVMAASLGLIEQVPFARETVEMGRIFDTKNTDYYQRELVKSLLVPAFVQWIAEQTDREKGEKVKRETKTVGEAVQSGIPVLREDLPKRNPFKTNR